jgi:hypothetical protein
LNDIESSDALLVSWIRFSNEKHLYLVYFVIARFWQTKESPLCYAQGNYHIGVRVNIVFASTLSSGFEGRKMRHDKPTHITWTAEQRD